MERGYVGILIPVGKAGRRIYNSAIDFSSAIKEGLIVGYYDAKERFHEVRKEKNPGKIIRNAVAIAIAVTPGGTVLAPMYLAWRGTVYLLKRNGKMGRKGEEREKEGDLVNITRK